MNFVIIGAGRVGLRTARVLKDSGHDVVLVEKDQDAIQRAEDAGFRVVENTGPLAAALEQAAIESADALAALTNDLNANFASCMIAKQHGCRTVMRFDETHSEDIYREYAGNVDELVNPEQLAATVVTNALTGGNVRAISDIKENLQLVEFRLTEASPMDGYSLQELELPGNAMLLAYATGDEPLRLPTDNDVLSTGDRLAILTDFDDHDDIHRLIVGESAPGMATS